MTASITTDKPEYVQGETVNVVVYINISGEEVIPIQDVVLEIYGPPKGLPVYLYRYEYMWTYVAGYQPADVDIVYGLKWTVLSNYPAGKYSAKVFIAGKNVTADVDWIVKSTIEPVLRIISPTEVVIGQEFEVTVTDDEHEPVEGAKVEVTLPDKTQLNLSTNEVGKVRITPQETGEIKIVAEKEGYVGVGALILVIERHKLEIISPTEVKTGQEFELTVIDEHRNPVNNTTLIITLPDLARKQLMSDGKPIGIISPVPGNIIVKAEKPDYDDATAKILVKSRKLQIMGPKEVTVGQKVEYVITDEEEDTVSDVDVTITLNGEVLRTVTTNELGKVEISLSESGNGALIAKKLYYEDARIEFSINELPVEPKRDWSLLWLVLPIFIIILLLIFVVYRGKVEIKKIIINNEVKITVVNKTRKDLEDCVIDDAIPSGAESHVPTLGVERRGNRLIWRVGMIKKGDKKIMEYKFKGFGVLPKAKITWKGGEAISK